MTFLIYIFLSNDYLPGIARPGSPEHLEKEEIEIRKRESLCKQDYYSGSGYYFFRKRQSTGMPDTVKNLINRKTPKIPNEST
jgi:hypothetical protein